MTLPFQACINGHPDVEITEKQAVVWSSDRVLGSIEGSINIADLKGQCQNGSQQLLSMLSLTISVHNCMDFLIFPHVPILIAQSDI